MKILVKEPGKKWHVQDYVTDTCRRVLRGIGEEG